MNNIVGNKLRSLRRIKGLTQEQVADYLHISQSAYARMENGESNSWSANIEGICEVFEISPEELLKSEAIIINNNQQGGNSAYYIHQALSEKLIEQYEARLKEKDEIIQLLKERIK
ncbi:helix-turn-helix transcriptional regulator [Galbibacter orientalis]|uniref:helix-turn-helix domain-containing protein n=1 Tax=Galbibacter orientalis TaxID=453852 RepID=UPI0030805C4A